MFKAYNTVMFLVVM